LRQITGKFAGGIEQIDAGHPARHPGLSLRAALIGLVGVAYISLFAPFNETVLHNTMLIGNHFPVGVVLFMLVLVLVVNAVLRRLPRTADPLDISRVVIRWVALLPAVVLGWAGPGGVIRAAGWLTGTGPRLAPYAEAFEQISPGLNGPAVSLMYCLLGTALLGAAVIWRIWPRLRPRGLWAGPLIGAGFGVLVGLVPELAGIGTPDEAFPPLWVSVLVAGLLVCWLIPPVRTRKVSLTWILMLACLIGVGLIPAAGRALGEPVAFPAGSLRFCLAAMLGAVFVGRRAERRAASIEPFTPAELVVIMTMMLAACAIPTSGFHRYWAQEQIAPFYLLAANPTWADVIRYLPDWLVPSTNPEDKAVVYDFYQGGASVPWYAWWRPALYWSLFIVPMFLGVFFLVAIFRRQWAEHEKLSFPLALISLELLRPPEKGRLFNTLFRSKLLWSAAGVVIVLQLWYGLRVYYPQLPRPPYIGWPMDVPGFNLWPAFADEPWRYLPGHMKAGRIYFAAIGVAYFISREMALSLWGFVVILAVVQMIGTSLNYPIQEAYTDNQIGGYIAMGLTILWIGRRHLARVFRSIWRRRLADEPTDTYLSERTAAIGLLICWVIATVWLIRVGMPPHAAILTVLTVFLLWLVIGRVVCESGLLFVQYGCWPHRFAAGAFPELIDVKTHTLMHFTTIAMTMDQREGMVPYIFNSVRMTDGTGQIKRRGRLYAVWIGCMLAALVLAGWVHLHACYKYGGSTTDGWATYWLPLLCYNSSVNFGNLKDSPDEYARQVERSHIRVAAGAGIVLALSALRLRFQRWPLHPIGYIVADSYPMQAFWFSILIAWACKSIIMRLGGAALYQKLRPLFLGLVVGDTLATAFWIIVKIVLFANGIEGKAILLLPG